MQEYTKVLKKLIQNPKAKNIIIILGILGVALILITEFFPNEDKNTNAATINQEDISSDDYVHSLERKLSEIVGSINGVGKSKVMITLENGVEYVFANEEKSNLNQSADGSRTEEKTNTERKLILVEDSEGKKQALVQTEIEPRVKGVVIVCEGGDDPTVQQRLTQVVTTALDISSKRVCITRLSN